MQRVAVERIEPELRRLWEAAGPQPSARTMTLVALCETREHAPIARQALEKAAPLHGARAVLVDWDPGETAAVQAEIALLPGPKGPAAELVRLGVTAAARSSVPDAVARLISPDLPVFVWWVGDLPDHETLFDRMAFGAQATVAVLSSNEMDLRDLPVLDAMSRPRQGTSATFAIADFTWQRLRTWQELVARFFDVPACAEDLSRIESVRIRFQQRHRSPERASNQAALFVGWLAARLGWSGARWSDRTAVMRAKDHDVTITFEGGVERGVLDGALVDVELRTRDARYRVHRAENDPCALCWEGERPGTPMPDQCVRVHVPDDATLLGRVLARPSRDDLYEASLHAAAALVAPIAGQGGGGA